MHDYLTRHLVATRPMTYAQRELVAGDPFFATAVDADYLVRCGRARDVQPAATPPGAAAAVAGDQAPLQQDSQGQTPSSQLDLVGEPSIDPTNVEGPAELAPKPADGLEFDSRGVLVPVAQQKPVTARGRGRNA